MKRSNSIREKLIADYLEMGHLKVGDRMPTVTGLAEQYGVSATTIGKALALLETEGWITKRQGSGIFVRATATPTPQRSGDDRPRIGCVIDSLTTRLAGRFFEGIDRAARRASCVVEIAATDGNLCEEQRQIQLMASRGVQGIVLCPTPVRKAGDEYLSRKFQDFPIVVVDLYQPDMRRSHVIFDNRAAGRAITRHLLEEGCRRVGFITYGKSRGAAVRHRAIEDRVEGYWRALEDAGLPMRKNCFLEADLSARRDDESYGVINFAPFLEMEPRPDALIVFDDLHVPETIAFLRSQGLRVPEDVRVAGFDNLQQAAWGDRFPTTSPDFSALGEKAFDLLLEEIHNPAPYHRQVILPCPLQCPESRRIPPVLQPA